MEKVYTTINSLEAIQSVVLSEQEERLKLLIDSLNDLFITTRKKFITNIYDGKFKLTKRILTDNRLRNVLKHKETIAIFSASKTSKFLTFDIDVNGDLELAETYAIKILEILDAKMEIKKENTLVNYSGNKGLHVHILFDKLVEIKKLKQLYNYVLAKLNVPTNVIEFRPTYKQAIKIPLQQHHVTKNVCNILDVENNFQVLSPYALLNVEKMDSELFELNLEELLVKEAEEIKQLRKTNQSFKQSVASATTFAKNSLMPKGMSRVSFTSISNSKIIKKKTIEPIPIQHEITSTFRNISEKCSQMIQKKTLLQPNTRHESTLALGTYCLSLGIPLEEAVDTVKEIISNTFKYNRAFISSDTTLEFALKEVERLVTIAYEHNYQFTERASMVQLFESELKFILSIPSKSVRDIALLLLFHDKQFNPDKLENTFTLSYRQVNAILGTQKAFKNIYKAYDYLIEEGLLEIVNRDIIDSQNYYKDTTKFKINYRQLTGNENERVLNIYLNSLQPNEFKADNFASIMFEANEVKQYYSKSTFYSKIVGLFSTLKTISGVYLHKIIDAVQITLDMLKNCVGDILNHKNKETHFLNQIQSFSIIQYIMTTDLIETAEEKMLNFYQDIYLNYVYRRFSRIST